MIKPVSYILDAMEHKTSSDEELIKKAYEFAKKAHEGQKRYSGEPYITHPIEVAKSLADIGMDPVVVAAGLLHDTLEDTDTKPEELKEAFGEEIYSLVEGVTKLGTMKYHGLKRHIESLRKLFAATAEDVRVMIIKLLDRLHNAQTLEHVPEHKRQRIALETIELYAAIADRLGMGVIKRKLEDAAFPYAYPEEYEKVRKLFKEAGGEDTKRLEKIHKSIVKKLVEYGIKDFKTEVRIKGLFSFYQKLKRKNWDLSKIKDIWALRIILPTTADCYTVLSIIHAEWRPIPGRIKDYIALPKPNGYQSIHTTIHTGDGGVLEIQIRTHEMHKEAQFGIASHLSYKEFKNSIPKESHALQWIKQFIPIRLKRKDDSPTKGTYKKVAVPEWVKEMAKQRIVCESDLEDIKQDFFCHRIFVFTPKGDVIDLPIGSGPIDFAFAVHTDLGMHVQSAKVNGKLVSLDSKLQNGDIIEIITNEKSKPTLKWLDYVKTANARRKIKSFLAKTTQKSF